MGLPIAPGKKKHILRLLALVAIGAGFLNYIQLSVPLKDFIWDIVWLILIGAAEWVADPLLGKLKFWKRLLLGLGAVAVILPLTFWLIHLAKQYGINQFYIAPFPWFLMGFGLLVWSLLISTDTLPD
jgi:hypothetical protein